MKKVVRLSFNCFDSFKPSSTKPWNPRSRVDFKRLQKKEEVLISTCGPIPSHIDPILAVRFFVKIFFFNCNISMSLGLIFSRHKVWSSQSVQEKNIFLNNLLIKFLINTSTQDYALNRFFCELLH